MIKGNFLQKYSLGIQIAKCWGKPSKMGVSVIGLILLSNFSKVLQKWAFVHLKKVSKQLRPLERPFTQIYITQAYWKTTEAVFCSLHSPGSESWLSLIWTDDSIAFKIISPIKQLLTLFVFQNICSFLLYGSVLFLVKGNVVNWKIGPPCLKNISYFCNDFAQ